MVFSKREKANDARVSLCGLEVGKTNIVHQSAQLTLRAHVVDQTAAENIHLFFHSCTEDFA